MLKTKQKSKVIEKHRVHETDTGSSAVQIAILTTEIAKLTAHLKQHPKDNHSRRGLLAMVSRRRRLMDYLAKSDPRRFSRVTKKLGLKR